MGKNVFITATTIWLVLLSLGAGAFVVEAQPAPSVPQFALKFVDNSYYVPPTYGLDQYTGEMVVTKAGYHVQNQSIEVSIKNQPFVSTAYYNVSVRGHYGGSWVYYYYYKGSDYYQYGLEYYLDASSSASTVLVFGLGGNNGSDVYDLMLGNVSAGGEVDFRVQAVYGYFTTVQVTPASVPFADHSSTRTVFTLTQASNWSAPQTITVPENYTVPSTTSAPTASPISTLSTTPSPSIPEFQPWVLPVLLLSITLLALTFTRKRVKT